MKNILFLLTIIILYSCNEKIKTEDIETTSISENKPIKKEDKNNVSISSSNKETAINSFKKGGFEQDPDHKNLLGYYVGSFNTTNYENVSKKNGSYSNKINISVDYIRQDSLFGHSVVAGNIRPFKGTFDSENLSTKVLEPGDDKYDGIFEFTFISKKTQLKGVWIANNPKLAVPKREYNLVKKDFEYNPEYNLSFSEEYNYDIGLSASQDNQNGEMEAINPKIIGELNASTQTLSNKNIENLNKGELEILRNLIYARHGYSFKNRKMRYFFDSQIDWYIPVSTDIRNELTNLEKKNIDLIKRYEQHAKRYYDYFGR